jgi:hypothetical protein
VRASGVERVEVDVIVVSIDRPTTGRNAAEIMSGSVDRQADASSAFGYLRGLR